MMDRGTDVLFYSYTYVVSSSTYVKPINIEILLLIYNCGNTDLHTQSSTNNVSLISSVKYPISAGLSECGVMFMSVWIEDCKYWKPDCTGYPIDGFGSEILGPDSEGKGEVAMFGRQVFMGYLDEEEMTKSSFNSEHRFLSGDVGYMDKDGFFHNSGRIKGQNNFTLDYSSCNNTAIER